MQIAKSESTNRKKMSIVLTILVLSTGIVSAALLIVLNKNQSSKTPAQTPVEISCPLKGVCKWDPINIEGIVYRYTITNKSTGKVIVSDRTALTQILFDVEPKSTYECTVSALNSCGEGDASTQSCTTTGGTPPPTVTGTPTGTPNPSHSPTPTLKLSGTPSPTSVTSSKSSVSTSSASLSTTPTPTPKITTVPTTTSSSSSLQTTPSPTVILIVQATNTPGPSPTTTSTTSSPTSTTSTTSTTSLPQTGILLPTLAVLSVAGIIILVGLIL